VKSFFLALTFLSVLPVPSFLWQGEDRIERALRWFPVVGGILGAITFLFFYTASRFLPEKSAFLISFFFYHLLNGGLHLDGLADFSDAFFGAKKNEVRFKEILKDSHIGVMGVIALIFYFFSIFSLSEKILLSPFFFITFGMSGRASIVILATKSKSLFNEGLGRLFIEKSGTAELFFAIATYLAVMAYFGNLFLLTAMVVLILSLIFKFYILKRFGGFSGDIFGAGCSLIEIIVFVIFAGCQQ